MPPLVRHLYVHIPFCAKVCPYCAFYVHGGSAGLQKRFAKALARELTHAREQFDLQPETIYFGGGTPSMLSAELFNEIALALPTHRAVEFTLEANPATVTAAKMEAWAAAGVNRISLGAQSFDPEYLKLLGRQHAPEDIPETMQALRGAGFNNLNLDLMFSLPMMEEGTWDRTLAAALACEPDHLSAYALTYEEDTPFFERLHRGEWKTDEAREIRMFNTTVNTLHEAKLDAYEISNFARSGFESTHNLAYWRGEDFLGFGPSGCSTVGTQRWKNIEDTEAYICRVEHAECLRTEIEVVTPEIRQRERIMFGLRTREGIDLDLVKPYGELVCRLIEEGLASATKERLTLTPRGRLVADSIAEEFC